MVSEWMFNIVKTSLGRSTIPTEDDSVLDCKVLSYFGVQRRSTPQHHEGSFVAMQRKFGNPYTVISRGSRRARWMDVRCMHGTVLTVQTTVP